VLTVHVRGTELASGTILHACLHLVDLAGSERVDRSEATGDRLKEAQHINRSLSALGDVVSALAQKNSHVPYRNSKLTQLLQDSLGGQAKTLMFVHISPDLESYGETLSTLKFSERVASVELGAAKSNKESRELRDLKDQVALLKEVVSKKDMEIERLNMTKGKWGLDKPKTRVASCTLSHDFGLDIHDQKVRRQTLDSRVHLEKSLDSRPQEDFQALFSAPLKVSVSNDARGMGASTNTSSEMDTSKKHTSHEGKFDGGAHAHVQEGCVEQSLRGSLITYPQYRSVIEKDSYLQAMSLRESFEEKTSNIQFGTETERVGRVVARRGSFISSFKGKNSKGLEAFP
ncbi:hypothetical protein GOP47_0016605, partial [Adiantum capillus-veneris]